MYYLIHSKSSQQPSFLPLYIAFNGLKNGSWGEGQWVDKECTYQKGEGQVMGHSGLKTEKQIYYSTSHYSVMQLHNSYFLHHQSPKPLVRLATGLGKSSQQK